MSIPGGVLAAALLCVAGISRADEPSEPENAFRAALAPYGNWFSIEAQGRVWRPATEIVSVDFRPYATHGHWAHTRLGWAWASDWDWGWAPFHYGRWLWDETWGWVWSPGTTWGPAWVDWRFGGGYAGWAPLAPLGFAWRENHPRWFFCQSHYLTSNHVEAFALEATRAREAMAVTTPASEDVDYEGVSFFTGPPIERVRKETGEALPELRIDPPRPGEVRAWFQIAAPKIASPVLHPANAPDTLPPKPPPRRDPEALRRRTQQLVPPIPGRNPAQAPPPRSP